VKIREHDLGRALRDEQGRVFYVVEDPEHGRYAARTRKGSPKDLQRYREIESGVAKLDSDEDRPAAANLQAHDATGSKRRNPLGTLLLIVILAAVAALGYVFVSHPEWLGMGSPESDTPDEQPGDESTSQAKPKIIHTVAERQIPQSTASEPAKPKPHAPGIAAAPLPTTKPNRLTTQRDPLPDGMDNDPEPIFVDAATPPQREEQVKPAPRRSTPARSVPITLPKPQPRQVNYDDFHHTASGLRYKITHLTDGVSARAGNYLTIRYTAQTLDGKPLINDATQSFILARGQAIRAFDEGLAGIREGEQLRLLVPRGHSENGTLPGIDRIPDQPFLLDVQLVSVRPGVTYIIEAPGDIDSRPCAPGDTIYVNYIARVEGRDEIIDATVQRGQPMRITLGNNEVIKGLELGITGMRPGESRQLTIPPYLAYGKYSVAGGLIPENAVLSFRLTLVGIVDDDE
jgi:FKBP-type peptidyl-prolyl cis-trans isomerase